MISITHIAILVLSSFGQLQDSWADVTSVLTLQMNDLYQINFEKDILNQFYTCLCDRKDQSCSVVLERDVSFSYQARLISVSRFPSTFNQSQDEIYSGNFICSIPTSFLAHQTMGCIRLKHSENLCEILEMCESINLIYGNTCENGFAGVFWLYPGRIHQQIDNRYVSLSQCGNDCFNRTSLNTPISTPSHVITAKTETTPPISSFASIATTNTTAKNEVGVLHITSTSGVKRVSTIQQETFKTKQTFIDFEVDVELIIIIAVSSGLVVILLSIIICAVCVCKCQGQKSSTAIETKKNNLVFLDTNNLCVEKPAKGIAYLCEAARQTGSAFVLACSTSNGGETFKHLIESELKLSSLTKGALHEIQFYDVHDFTKSEMIEMSISDHGRKATFNSFGKLDLKLTNSTRTGIKDGGRNKNLSESLSQSLTYEDVKSEDLVLNCSRPTVRDFMPIENKRMSNYDEDYYTTINDVITNDRNMYSRLNQEVKTFSNPYNKLQMPESLSHELEQMGSFTARPDVVTFSLASNRDCVTNACIQSCREQCRYCNLFSEGHDEDRNMPSISHLSAQKHIYFELEKEEDESSSEYSVSYEDQIIYKDGRVDKTCRST